MIGTTELIIIAVVIFVLFGASAIPKFARSIGQAKKEFDEGLKEGAANRKKDRLSQSDSSADKKDNNS